MGTVTITSKQELLTVIRTFAQSHGKTIVATLQELQNLVQRESEIDSPVPHLPSGVKLLQVGDKSSFQPIEPIIPKKGAESISDIIVEQRKQ